MVVVDPHIVAKTERLLLRPLKLEDAEDVVLMRKHPEVMKHTSVLTDPFVPYHILTVYRSILPSDDLERTKQWIQGTSYLAAIKGIRELPLSSSKS